MDETTTAGVDYLDYVAQEAKESASLMQGQIMGRLKRPNPETPVERLERRKAEALREVARLDELIKLFKANPSTERILQLLGVGV